MKKIKQIGLILAGTFIATIVISGIVWTAFQLYNYLEANKKYHYNGKKDDAYTQKMADQLTQNGFCIMGEVFDFDWDVAYVIEDNYLGEEQLAKKIGVDVNIPHVDSEHLRRIAFLKDNQLVYVHYRDGISITNEGIKIRKDAKLKKYKQDENNISTYFSGVEVDDFYDPENIIRLNMIFYNYIKNNPDLVISEHSVGDYEFILSNSGKQIIRQNKDGSEKISIFYWSKIEKYRLIDAYQIEVEGYKEIVNTIGWLEEIERMNE